jgi:hypothetical protein
MSKLKERVSYAITSIAVDLMEGVYQNDVRIIAKFNTAHDFKSSTHVPSLL